MRAVLGWLDGLSGFQEVLRADFSGTLGILGSFWGALGFQGLRAGFAWVEALS